LADDFLISREAICLVLGVDQVSIDDDIEYPASTFDQLRFDTRFFSNCVRQTGGLRGVVSLYAIGDAYLHPNASPEIQTTWTHDERLTLSWRYAALSRRCCFSRWCGLTVSRESGAGDAEVAISTGAMA